MNTKNIYIAQLVISKEVNFKGTLVDYVIGPGVKHIVEYDKLKYILVKLEKNVILDMVVKDLNTNKKYSFELPFDKGKLYVLSNKMIPFDAIYHSAKQHLSKKKILKMGNYAIDELLKRESEQKNK